MNRLPAGAKIFSFVLGRKVPYSGSVSPEILELRPGAARVRMQDRNGVRNHLNSIHAVALMNIAEIASGLALNSGVPKTGRAILTGFSIKYLKKARGPIEATCTCTLPTFEADEEVELKVDLKNTAGDVVATAQAIWRVGPKKP